MDYSEESSLLNIALENAAIVNSKKNSEEKKSLGQFFTSEDIAKFMSEVIQVNDKNQINILRTSGGSHYVKVLKFTSEGTQGQVSCSKMRIIN